MQRESKTLFNSQELFFRRNTCYWIFLKAADHPLLSLTFTAGAANNNALSHANLLLGLGPRPSGCSVSCTGLVASFDATISTESGFELYGAREMYGTRGVGVTAVSKGSVQF